MHKVLIILIIPVILYSQEFQISNSGSNRFSIDIISNNVYWQELSTGKVFITNMTTMETEEASFPSLPIFANRTHLAAYEHNEKLYLHDFDIGETRLILENVLTYPYFFSFSPNDRFIMIHNIFYELDTENEYVSPYNNIGMKPSWNSDSTICFGYEKYIENYSIISNEKDTLLFLADSLLLYSFDYNISENILAYSVDDINATPSNTLFIFNYLEDGKDSLIFDHWSGITQGACSNSYLALTELKWSRDDRNISFYSHPIINPGSGILVHFLDSNSTKLYTECDQYGIKYDTEWLGNDTIIYADHTRNLIFGFDILSPLTSVEQHPFDLLNSCKLECYPNPFNPSTTISYSITKQSQVQLKVFDVLGREVAELVNIEQPSGSYQVNFDASNLGSGVYFYQIKAGSFLESKKMILLK